MTGRAGGRRGRPRRPAGPLLVIVLLLLGALGAGLVTAGLTVAGVAPPQPAARQDTPAADADLRVPDEWIRPKDPVVTAMPRSQPTRVTVRRVGIDGAIMPLGLRPDRTVDVPPLDQAEKAGWYKLGPSPGEIGNAVIVGHVDTAAKGPSVFYELGALKVGDLIEVTRADRSVARFRVDRVASYPKTAFPTDEVYGPSNNAGLRLVTCGGAFDEAKRNYLDNVIVFATLTR